MALKSYFTGKTGFKFWGSIILMVIVLLGVPVGAFYLLDTITHHGEKIEVPSVVGKFKYDAEDMLRERGLTAVITDSTYRKSVAPGTVLEQKPNAGYEVKSGRVVYLTVNMMGEPTLALPDVVRGGSLREAQATLKSLGFKLTPNEVMIGRPKDLVIGVKQNGKNVHPGETVSRERPLTIIVGGGEPDPVDSLSMDEMESDINPEDNDFDFEL